MSSPDGKPEESRGESKNDSPPHSGVPPESRGKFEAIDEDCIEAVDTEDEGDLVGGGAVPIENKDFQRIAELLPPKEKRQLISIMRQEIRSHSGWLPTPNFMKKYEKALPGLAERIVAMPEREQRFRHDTTYDVIRRDYRLRSTGQLLGMASLILILAFCVFLAVLGFPHEAAIVAGLTIVGTVGVFVVGQVNSTSSTSKDLVDQSKE